MILGTFFLNTFWALWRFRYAPDILSLSSPVWVLVSGWGLYECGVVLGSVVMRVPRQNQDLSFWRNLAADSSDPFGRVSHTRPRPRRYGIRQAQA